MHRAVGVGIVVTLALLPSCSKKEAASTSSGGSAGSAVEVPVTNVDEMLKRSFERLGDPYFAADIDVEYVASDGTLDPAYGVVIVESGKRPRPKPPKPPDDPNRPIGAPQPEVAVDHEFVEMALAKCPEIRWRQGEMTVRDGSCSMFMTHKLRAPRCTVAEILASAKAAGAPANALAKISFDIGFGDDAVQTWVLKIDDEPRGIHFTHEGNDDCDPIVEKP